MNQSHPGGGMVKKEWVVSAPYYSYEGVLSSGRTSARFPSLREAEEFKRRVEIYATVNPDSPHGIGARFNPDFDIAANAWDSWEDVREFGFDDGCLTGPLVITQEETIITRVSERGDA